MWCGMNTLQELVIGEREVNEDELIQIKSINIMCTLVTNCMSLSDFKSNWPGRVHNIFIRLTSFKSNKLRSVYNT